MGDGFGRVDDVRSGEGRGVGMIGRRSQAEREGGGSFKFEVRLTGTVVTRLSFYDARHRWSSANTVFLIALALLSHAQGG